MVTVMICDDISLLIKFIFVFSSFIYTRDNSNSRIANNSRDATRNHIPAVVDVLAVVDVGALESLRYINKVKWKNAPV